MIISSLKAIFNRDLKRLADEINTYKSDYALWVTEKGIPNSAGNLCIHLIGNLKTYVGRELGKIDYERNRELEFSSKDTSRFELLRQLDETTKIVNTSLDGLDDEDLLNDYPLIVFEDKMSTGYFLIHLTTHLGYHLGQINYHRRMLDT